MTKVQEKEVCGKEAVEQYFDEYFEHEKHLPRKKRHRLVIAKDGNIIIAQLNWFSGCASKVSRSKCGQVLGVGKLCNLCGIHDANIKRVLIVCHKLGIDKEKIQKLMDHFNEYHPKCPITWKDLF